MTCHSWISAVLQAELCLDVHRVRMRLMPLQRKVGSVVWCAAPDAHLLSHAVVHQRRKGSDVCIRQRR